MNEVSKLWVDNVLIFSLQLFPETHTGCQHTHRPIHRAQVAMSTGPLVWDALLCTVGIPRGVYHLT